MRNPVRSSVQTVLRSNDQSRVLSSLIADQPKYAFIIAKEWFGNRASSHSTRIGKAIWSLKKIRLICTVKLTIKQHNSPRTFSLKGYKINLRSLVNSFCMYLTYEKSFWRRKPKEFTEEDKRILSVYITTATCKDFFRKHVIARKLYGTSYKLKDSVFGALNILHKIAVFEDEKAREVRKEIAAYYKREDTTFIGQPEDEEIFKKIENIVE